MPGSLAYALSLKTSGYTGPMAGAQTQTSGFISKLGGVSSKLLSLPALLATAAGGAGALAGAFKAFSVASSFESTTASFGTLLGSQQKAVDLLKEIKSEAATTPNSFNELAGAARSLLSVSGEDGVIQDMRMIGDLASAAQRPVGELATMYAKILGGDLVQGEDLNQIGDALGGDALKEFAKVLGVDSIKEVRKLGSEGKINGAVLQQVFRNLTAEGGLAFGAMAAQSETTKGKISTLKDNVNDLFLTLGTPINDALKPIFDEAITMVKRIGLGLKGTVEIVQGAIANGSIGELISTSLQVGIKEGVNFGVGSFLFLGEALLRSISFSLKQAWTFMTGGFNESFGNIFKGLAIVINGVGKLILSKMSGPMLEVVATFQAGMNVAISQIFEKLGKIPGLGKALGLDGFKADSFSESLDFFKDQLDVGALKDEGEKLIEKGLAQTGKGIQQRLDVSADNFKKAFDGLEFDKVNIFDTEGDKANLERLAKAASPEGWEKLLQSLNGTGQEAEDAKDKIRAAAQIEKNNNLALAKQGGAAPAAPGAGATDPAADTGGRRGLLNAAESLAARFARQSDADKTSFKSFANKSGLDRRAVSDFAKSKNISIDAALKQLAGGTRAATPAQRGGNAQARAQKEAADRAASEGTLKKIESHLTNIATV